MARRLLNLTLLNFLKSQGLTHMQLRGIEPTVEKEKTLGNDDNYILFPVIHGLINFEESDIRVESIDSSEITDMIDVEFGITFWVELSDDLAEKYISGTNSK